jgi:hypothetical protein
MQLCNTCHQYSPPANRFCDTCGALFEGLGSGRQLITVGRDRNNDVRVPNKYEQVSRFHAEIIVEGGRVYIEDKGTKNGTYVDGKRVTGTTPIGLHSRIKFGSYVLNTAELQPFLSGGGAGFTGFPSGAPMMPPGAAAPAPALSPAIGHGPVYDSGVGMKPHRGGVVLALGIFGLFLFPCGIIAWVMADKDLQAIELGYMDPFGRSNTNAGRVCGIIGLFLFVLGAAGVLTFLLAT